MRLNSRRDDRNHDDEMEEFSFENLQNTDKIIVTTNLNETVRIVDDLATIQAVLAFVQSHSSGWMIPAGGVPVARLRLNFYAGDRLLGNVGVGPTFLTALQLGTFWAKTSHEADREQLLHILGLEF